MKLFQIKLRTFMLIVTAICVFVGWIAVNHQQHQREQRAIELLGNRIRLTENVTQLVNGPALVVS